MGSLDSVFSDLAGILFEVFTDDLHTLRYKPDATYDLRTGMELAGTELSWQVHITPPKPYDSRYVNGSTILATDLYTKIQAKELSGTVPEPDTFSLQMKDGRVFRVLPPVTRKLGGDSDVIYILHLRK